MGTRDLIIMEGEKDMDLLINARLYVNFSQEGKCDPAHPICHQGRQGELVSVYEA